MIKLQEPWTSLGRRQSRHPMGCNCLLGREPVRPSRNMEMGLLRFHHLLSGITRRNGCLLLSSFESANKQCR